ncbi:helix-turn-helix domain-containing protein [Oscillibacter sp.]|uniref:helix-turn-helix domain-containing protein n=1 Tax=Oscillibacter sp. TaxID=1945593 RepID=UPI002D80C92E|nr:helix-turn-helix transcriptional regulator [Oscillibacter sp.]
MKNFPETLKACRKNRHESQEVVAVHCGVSYSTYRRYETGEREPTLSTLCTLAKYFGVTLDQLAGWEPLPFKES